MRSACFYFLELTVKSLSLHLGLNTTFEALSAAILYFFLLDRLLKQFLHSHLC